MEGYSPGIEIEFVSLGFHLNKIESNRLEFNIIELEPEGLDLHAYVDEISTSAAATIYELSSLFSILHTKIKLFTLELLDC